MFLKDIHFSELVNTQDWQAIQDSLAEVLEISIRTFSLDGKIITKTSRSNRFLEEILPKVRKNGGFCKECLLSNNVESIRYLSKEVNIKCPFGMNTFVIPVKAAGERTIAYLVIGPVILSARKNIFEYAEDAKEIGIKLEKLSDALIEISLFSHSRINSVINLAKKIFSHIAQTEYHKRRLAEIRPEVVELDPLFSRYYEEKILNSLLNSCTLALDADSGSVMTLDTKTKMLHIKASTKLDDDIISRTNVKMGDGIAGLAAATSKMIILPKDKDLSSLSGRMKRTHIKSSMIVPFSKAYDDDVYGVINLNIVRKEAEFSERDIFLVKELVRMASIALTPLKQIVKAPKPS
ncbi:MAG: PocR ligand-binding domain-containing protein [Candidatus Omnitrophota bacterium]